MPVTVPQALSTIVPAMAGASMVGVGVPRFVRGLGIGLSTWTPTILISTQDTGTLGSGAGVPIPITIPQPSLYGNLLTSMKGQNLIGVMSPLFVLGLSNGLVALYLQAFTLTAHVGVGVGAGVATFRPPPAYPSIQAGFIAVGMAGQAGTKLARALAQGLEKTFRTLVLAQPIVGPPSIVGSSGRGFGNIV